MSIENERGVTITDPHLVKIFHVWLSKVYFVMPQQAFKSTIKESEFYKFIKGQVYPDASVRTMKKAEFLVFAHKFIAFTYAGILGYYYDIDILINLIDEINSNFKPFMKTVNDGYKDRQKK